MSRKKPEKKEISQEWLTTYSDMMTLILTFFVLLYSFSLVDQKKFEQLSQSLSSAFNGGSDVVISSSGSLGPIPSEGTPGKDSTSDLSLAQGELEKMYKDVMGFVKSKDLEAKVSIKKDTRGILIEIQDKILFDSGKADIKKESFSLLNDISDLLNKFPNEVIIEGHTDNLPINRGYYKSNWELSTDRAVKVVKYFVDNKNMTGKRFQAVGCGEYRPIATNSTPQGRQINRRVNILIVSTKK